ncbi:Kielin/chordin-like protein [Labeo rohita]|uniref:Kielin/chordin-like protein n=1 Tax=Labeo rohita TaxID=84645 RepID=A0ABQ8LRV4_LABRO|nr:Kielin/chordin-like protein [Labeo rohita]
MELKVSVGGVFMSLLVLWNVCDSVQTHQDANHPRSDETVINLLEALNVTRSPHGVRKVKGRDPETPAWRFRSKTPHLKLPQKVLDYLFNTSQGILGLHLVGLQNKGSEATLISFTSSAEGPLLELVSNTKADWLQLEFRSPDGNRNEVLKVPGGSPFTGRGWVRMALSVEPRQVVLYVDCQDVVVLKLKEGGRILSLDFPQDLQVTFSSTAGKKSSKFNGGWQTAELSTRAYEKHSLPDAVIPTMPAMDDLDMMQDQAHRGDEIKCVWEGQQKDEGSRWSPDSRTVCFCTHGRVQCDRSSECSFHGNIYSNGDVFDPDDCNRCTCDHGRVECNVNPCPSQSCQQPPAPQETCCPVCQTRCEYEGEFHENGDVFVSRSNPCLQCTCSNSQVRCDPVHCQPTTCPTSYRRPGECCPTCSACSVDGRPYNGSYSTVDGCQTCTCQAGNQACVDVQQCPQTCQDGVRPPFGSCCRDCSRCNFEGQVILDGVSVQPSRDPCKRCVCNSGNIVCDTESCPKLPCNLVETEGRQCCPRCRSCVQDSVRHLHGSQWKLSNDPCTTCTCTEGQVQCESERCDIHCRNPASPPLGSCCSVCDGCSVNGIDIPNRMTLPQGSPCDPTCTCENGNINCVQLQPCPPPSCHNPVQRQGECCARCEECRYEGEVYVDGQVFTSKQDPRLRCQCSGGQVTCESASTSCSPQRCEHPTKPHDQCRPSCNTCEYEGSVYENGQEFRPPGGGCLWNGIQYEEGATWAEADQRCSCNGGQVTCSSNCPQTNPAPCPPNPTSHGSCGQCQYNQRMYENGQTFQDPDDPCRTCTCQDGHTRCASASCPQQTCGNAYTPPGDCCPQCPVNPCEYDNRVIAHGDTFPNPSNPCEDCVCSEGNVNCGNRECPRPNCNNPRPGTCCQNNCNGCRYVGNDYPNGIEFPHPTDKCRTCPHSSDCTIEGRQYTHLQQFHHPGDSCQSCSCTNGVESCRRRPCPSAVCPHPVIQECCRTCDDPADPCGRCMCRNGHVTCSKMGCHNPGCSNPTPRPDQCCPACDGCLYHGRDCGNGERFPDPTNQCQDCTCMNGSVSCTPVSCPEAPCRQPVRLPGECCPTCLGQDGAQLCDRRECPQQCTHPGDTTGCCPVCDRCLFEGQIYGNTQTFYAPSDPCKRCVCQSGSISCIYDGVEHLEGSTWFASSSPCMSCMCVNGVTTCSKVHCLSTCVNQISVPGECCPVCADCVYNGRVYSPGESFHPSDNPCEICTCEVMPDGGQHMRCYRKQCPKPLSNCTATLIGNEVLATDDPCFTCQCKDLTWTCIHRGCPPLSCPPADQHTPPDSCCPICDECVLEGDQTRVPNGRRWTDKENECVTCICNCCPECTAIISVFYAKEAHEHCVYDKQRYNHNDHWEVDECTSCSCVYGDVPGMCCPHCIPHPATCVVFGDPHYRTFDGKMVNFQGTVHVSNEDRGRKGVSWTKEVTVLIGDTVVQLLQDWIVKVDYEPVSLPFLKEPYVYLERKTNTILLNTNVGLKVLWNGRSHLEVSVPGTYKKKMCGLCGNFNNYSQDDMKLRNGQITTSEAVFGNNWKVGSGNSSLQCPDVKNINPCNKAGYSARKTANARCAVLKSPVFKRCHKLVPPEMFYASCVYDLCACGSNMDECLCEVLEAYTSECREAGVILQWRSPTLCAVGCPLDRGYVFDECGPPCPKTCFNKDVPLGVIEAHCFKPCVPGCQCPAGLVEHNAHCIAPEKCPKIILENLRKTRKFHQTSRGINSVNLDI